MALPDATARLVVFLAHRFDLVDEPIRDRLTAPGAPPPSERLLAEGHCSVEQLNELIRLADLLTCRHADRGLAGRARDQGLVSEDEISYAFDAQVKAWRESRTTRSVGAFLVTFGSIDEGQRRELAADG